MRLLHSRLPNVPEFGLSRSTPTARPSFDAAGSILERSSYTSLSTATLQNLRLAIAPLMTTLCSCCAINTDENTREPPAPPGTRVGCKVTRGPVAKVVYFPLYMFRPYDVRRLEPPKKLKRCIY